MLSDICHSNFEIQPGSQGIFDSDLLIPTVLKDRKTVFFKFSVQLGVARMGCTVGNMVVNHPLFADDTCVFGPSLSSLQ